MRFPELAAEFSVDTSAMTKQLPTVALFYRGREVKSDLSSRGSAAQTPPDGVFRIKRDRCADCRRFSKTERSRAFD